MVAEKWKSRPGSSWLAGMGEILPGEESLGFPVLRGYDGELPDRLVEFGARVDRVKDRDRCGVHFFLDDYRFERVWNCPRRGLEVVRKFGVALSPDFSVYVDWPRAVQIWNVYRSRWLGAWWERNGVAVIPTVSWGDVGTYDFAFRTEGFPRAVCRIGTGFFVPVSFV